MIRSSCSRAGAAGNTPITDTGGSESRAFGEALASVLRDLASTGRDGRRGRHKTDRDRGQRGRRRPKRKAGSVYRSASSVGQNRLFLGRTGKLGRRVAAVGRSGVKLIPNGWAFFRRPLVVRNVALSFGEEIERKASVYSKAERNTRPAGPGTGKTVPSLPGHAIFPSITLR